MTNLISAKHESQLFKCNKINIHNVNSLTDDSLDQDQQHGITPIAWCPLGGLAYPAWGNAFYG